MDFFSQKIVSGWAMGDVLEIFGEFPSLLFSAPTQIREGLPIFVPVVRIKNMTRNSEIRAYLISEAVMGALRVVSVDFYGHSIILNDATSWVISPEDGELLNLWEVNDHVLIGHNTGLQNSMFESVLLNANKQSLVRAREE